MFAVMMYLKKHYLRAKSNNDIEQMAGVNISVFPKTATKNCFVNLKADERQNIETMKISTTPITLLGTKIKETSK